MEKHTVNLEELLVSEPQSFDIDEKLINVDEQIFFEAGSVKTVVVENDAGLRKVCFYNEEGKFSFYPLLYKRKFSIEEKNVDNEKIVIIETK